MIELLLAVLLILGAIGAAVLVAEVLVVLVLRNVYPEFEHRFLEW